jgi:ribosome-associated toxin RatA of RatAB toxin-antitoxin module
MKVDKNGHPSSYRDDRTYFEWLLKDEITKAVKELIVEEMKSKVGNIKKAIKKQIQSESGSSLIANALLNGLTETLKDSWRSTFKIEIEQSGGE